MKLCALSEVKAPAGAFGPWIVTKYEVAEPNMLAVSSLNNPMAIEIKGTSRLVTAAMRLQEV